MQNSIDVERYLNWKEIWGSIYVLWDGEGEGEEWELSEWDGFYLTIKDFGAYADRSDYEIRYGGDNLILQEPFGCASKTFSSLHKLLTFVEYVHNESISDDEYMLKPYNRFNDVCSISCDQWEYEICCRMERYKTRKTKKPWSLKKMSAFIVRNLSEHEYPIPYNVRDYVNHQHIQVHDNECDCSGCQRSPCSSCGYEWGR